MRILLEHGRATPAQLRRKLGGAVSKTAIRTDLEVLHAEGLIRPTGEGRERHWLVDPTFLSRTVGPLDQISMLLGRQLTSFLHGTQLHEVIRRIEDDVPERLPPHLRANFARKFRAFQEPFRRYDQHDEALIDILDGLLRQRELRLEYARGGTRYRYDHFRPLTLVVYRRALYLLGREGEAPDVLRLAVDRICACEVARVAFDYPQDWDPDAELASGFGIYRAERVDEVVLRFPASRDKLVRARQWHATQEIVTAEDGRTELRFRAGGQELVRFALEWGAACEVIAPTWLRTAVRTELRSALHQYGDEP